MHGALLHGFKQFAIKRAGRAAWSAMLQSSGAGGWYLATDSYDDDELVRLSLALANHLQCPVAQILEEFGEALVPTLLSLYGAFLDPQWRTLDLLMNAEAVIHRTVRARSAMARPPTLRPLRISEREVHIEYSSPRRLCALAIGICRGVAAHYGESISVDQPECTFSGGAICRIVVHLT